MKIFFLCLFWFLDHTKPAHFTIKNILKCENSQKGQLSYLTLMLSIETMI